MHLGRSTVDEVYTQITTDLSEAENELPEKLLVPHMTGKFTKGAAQSLLGEVYLTLKQYPEAVAAFKKVC